MRFMHRWILVTETSCVVMKTKFSYRSYESRHHAVKAQNSHRREPMVRRYVVDRDTEYATGKVILP